MIIFPVFYCIDLEEKIVLTAIELGFSRNEVEEVYDQLWAEGVDFESLEQGINMRCMRGFLSGNKETNKDEEVRDESRK